VHEHGLLYRYQTSRESREWQHPTQNKGPRLHREREEGGHGASDNGGRAIGTHDQAVRNPLDEFY
jgi:hypothetical protein